MYHCIAIDPEDQSYLVQYYGACSVFDHLMNCQECEHSGKKRFYNTEGKVNYLVRADKYNYVYNKCVDECPANYVTNDIDFTCDPCASDEYFTNNQCKSCTEISDECLICSDDQCLKCINGFYVDFSGGCEDDDSLPDCNSDEVLNSEDVCEDCGSCETCHFDGLEKICDSCKPNKVYSLTLKNCIDSSEIDYTKDFWIDGFASGDYGSAIPITDFPS